MGPALARLLASQRRLGRAGGGGAATASAAAAASSPTRPAPRLSGLLRLLAVRAGRAAGEGAEAEELPVSESARGHWRG